MPGPPQPHDEEARLQALRRLGAVGTGPESRLECLAALASNLMEAPMAAISLIDRDRQWLKSCLGLPFHETTRDEAFCAYTILQPGRNVVPDTWRDERFAAHPLVHGKPHVRAYAGSPMTCASGHRVGALCVFDTVPREFTPAQLGALDALAAMAIREIESSVNGGVEGGFDQSPEGVFRSQPGGGFLSANPAMARLLGFDAVGAMMEALPDVGAIYVQPGRREELAEILQTRGVALGFESKIRRRDGTHIWISENVRAELDAKGEPVRFEGTAEDVTARRGASAALARENEALERRVQERTAELAAANEALRAQVAQREHAEAGLRRSEGKFRALLENAQDLISIIDSSGAVLYSSPSLTHILGYEPEEMAGENVFTFIHPGDRQEVMDNLTRILREGAAFVRCELRFLHRDGDFRLLESVGSLAPPDSPVIGVVVNSRDITERKRFETGLENHARLQEATAELGRRALTCADEQEMFQAAAELVARALRAEGSSIDERLPGGRELLPRAGVGWAGSAALAHWRRTAGLPGPEPLAVTDLRLDGTTPEGETGGPLPASAASALIRAGGDGEPLGTVRAFSARRREFNHEEVTFLQTVADLLSTVIGRQRNQEALRLVEARYEGIVANTPGMVYQFLLRADGTLALPFASEGSREIYGVEPAALTARPQLALGAVHPEDQASLDASIAQSAASLEACHWEGRMVLAGGTKWIQCASRPRRLPSGDVLWDGIMMDVSERRRSQEALRAAKEEAERASNAKSEFLSRMSHELRTPLNAILGFGQLLEMEDLGPSHNQSVEYILDGGRRLLELVDGVLDLARIETGRVTLTSEPVDLGAALEATCRLVGALAKQRGILFLHPPPRLPCVALGDQARLGQVLCNLVSNAVKHAPVGSRVRLACRETGDGRRMRLAVTNQGQGLSAEECAGLFAAFDGPSGSPGGRHGTGLGLAISRRLMEAMGGTIGVRSRPGAGATFFIELPAATATAARPLLP